MVRHTLSLFDPPSPRNPAVTCPGSGLPARVSAGKLELHFGDETRLEELVETLESL